MIHANYVYTCTCTCNCIPTIYIMMIIHGNIKCSPKDNKTRFQ